MQLGLHNYGLGCVCGWHEWDVRRGGQWPRLTSAHRVIGQPRSDHLGVGTQVAGDSALAVANFLLSAHAVIAGCGVYVHDVVTDRFYGQ